jgi:hypothetical protein
MAILYSDNFNQSPANSDVYESIGPVPHHPGQLVAFRATIDALPATGDTWRFLKVPKGARMFSLNTTNVKTGTVTDAPGTLGWEETDPDAFDADVVFETDATTSSTPTDLVVDVATEDEDYLSVVFGTINGCGTVAATVWGSYFVPVPI